uniref:Protein KRI1 homolog n=1 Tax=Schistocephalus solidus TaxID=70667 RepID=A0A0V0J417_SCHSO
MEFKINEDFAKRYNMYRQKEEYQKLKSRFGDVKISKKSANKTAGDGESDFDSDSSSSSSSSATSSTAEEWEQREHEDFLRLYDALCRGDPVVNDPNKTWFRPRPEEGDKEGIRMEEEEEEEKKKDDARSKKKKKKKSAEKPLLLKDHVRELLLSGDTADLEAQDVADSKNWNGKKNEDPSVQKHAFLRETEGLFEISDGEEAPLLQRKMPSTTGEQESQKACGGKSLPDTSHFTFAINGSGADQEFLRDYLVNRRWKSSEPAKKAKQQPRKTDDSPDALVDALLDATTAVNRNQSKTTALMADEDLDADDEFLVKARQFEYRWNNNDANLVAEYPRTTAIRSRFEEEDRDFIKSYPRNITSTLRQPAPGKLTRAEKRKAHEERKRQKKAAKMAELQHLKRLKIAEFAEKLERIRKTCGDGVSLGPLDRFANAAVEESAEAGEEETVAEEVVDALENDWNPEEHDRLVQKLFGKEYYGAVTGDDDLDEPPAFSDDDDEDEGDLNSGRYQPRRRHRDEAVRDLEPAGDDEEAEEPVTLTKNHSHASAIERAAKDLEGTLAPRSRGRKRAHVGSRLKAALDRRKPIFDPTKNPDFEKYFDEFYQLDCEDILTGSRPGEDIHCRFKYREVKPNDFGLTTEEILAADDKELNRYASVKLMSAYRTEEEEERDVRKYHRQKMQLKKHQLIPSLLGQQPDAKEEGQDLAVADQSVSAVPAANPSEDLHGSAQHQLSKKTLKRLRKKANKSLLAESVAQQAQSSEEATHSTQVTHSCTSDQKHNHMTTAAVAVDTSAAAKRCRHNEEPTGPAQPPAKKHRHSSGKPKISKERLEAAGIDVKQFRYMHFNKERGSN